MIMPSQDDRGRLRLLECWLPLAQELSQGAQWHCTPEMLEDLVLAAAPALEQARTLAEARGILWYYWFVRWMARR